MLTARLARELVGGLVAKAAAMSPPAFVRVDGGLALTLNARSILFTNCTACPATLGTVIQAYLKKIGE